MCVPLLTFEYLVNANQKSPKTRNAVMCPTGEIAASMLSISGEQQKLQDSLRLGGRLLLLLALVLGEGKLEDLEDLLIRDLLVGLELGQVPGGRPSKLCDAVLGDGCVTGQRC